MPTDPQLPTPRVVTGRLCRIGQQEDDFDREFWRGIPPHRRVELLWDMVLDALAVKGIADEPRLQRSVGRLQRR